jgi:hypothetical protein
VTSGATARLRRQRRNAVDHYGAYERFGKGDISAILIYGKSFIINYLKLAERVGFEPCQPL